jgi:hypothetical protein
MGTSQKKNDHNYKWRLAFTEILSQQSHQMWCSLSWEPCPHCPLRGQLPLITCCVRAAGIPPGFLHGLGHSLDDFWLQGSCCVVVHVHLPGRVKGKRLLRKGVGTWGQLLFVALLAGASHAQAGQPQVHTAGLTQHSFPS